MPRQACNYKLILELEGIHSSQSCYAITQLAMPAMSPTMTEGGIANWKKKEGESFSGGDILLEIVCSNLCARCSIVKLKLIGNGQGNYRRRSPR